MREPLVVFSPTTDLMFAYLNSLSSKNRYPTTELKHELLGTPWQRKPLRFRPAERQDAAGPRGRGRPPWGVPAPGQGRPAASTRPGGGPGRDSGAAPRGSRPCSCDFRPNRWQPRPGLRASASAEHLRGSLCPPTPPKPSKAGA